MSNFWKERGRECHGSDKNITGEGKQSCIHFAWTSELHHSHLSPFFETRAIDDSADVETKNPIRIAEDTFRPVDLTVIYRRE